MKRLVCILAGHRWVRYTGIRLHLLHDGPEVIYADGMGDGHVFDCARCGKSEVF